jgi:hypothetical protein
MRILAVLAAAGCTGSGPEQTGTTKTEPTTVSTGETTVTFGECEGNGSSYRVGAVDTGGDPVSVSAEVDAESRIVAHLDNERANCCPDPSATFALAGEAVQLTFSDTIGSSGCDCLCIFDFVATSKPMPSGSYQLEVVYDGTSQAVIPVTVP